MADWQDLGAVDLILDECTTWAVVGLSGDTSRTAYRIASLMQERGKWSTSSRGSSSVSSAGEHAEAR